jgi:predicted DNA-binding antitoxin AbrB/MazE fold protein
MNIIQAIYSDKVFKPLFKDLKTWRSWLVFLKALFGLNLDHLELQIFKDCSGLNSAEGKPVREAYVIAGRRSGKSSISALIAVWLSMFKDWSKYLSPGERAYVFIIAVNKAQAKIIKGYISGILNLNSTFRNMVERELTEEIELKNGITISIKPCSFRSLRGYSILCVILEELAFWRWESESANPDKEILVSLKPALATIPESLLIGISTPYSRQGVLWEKFQKHFGKPGSVLIWRSPTKLMNPTIDPKVIDQNYQDDPESAAAEWGASFRRDISSFIDADTISFAIIPGRFGLAFRAENKYVGYINSSGGRADSFALAIGHKEKTNGKILLDVAREVRPPFRPAVVVEEFSEILKEYRISEIQADSYTGDWISSAFKEHEIEVANTKKSKSEIYSEFLPLLNNGQVELLDHKRLISQLKSLERKTHQSGKDLIDVFYPGGHDDVVNAAAGALVCASSWDPDDIGRVYYAGMSDGEESKEDESPDDDVGEVYFSSRSGGRNLFLEEKIRASLRRGKKSPKDD